MSNLLAPAIQYLNAGQTDAAERYCLQLSAADADNADALHLLAIIYAQTQRIELANCYFLNAITCAPERGDFLGNYANLLLEQGHASEALQYCQRALDKGQPRPELLNTLGNAQYKTGEFANAVESYRQALLLQPDYPEALNNLGQALSAQQDYFGAEACFHQALSLQPYFHEAAINLEQVDTRWLKPIEGGNVKLQRYQPEAVDFLWDCYHNQEFMHFYNRFMQLPVDKAHFATQLTKQAQAHPLAEHAINWIISTQDENYHYRPVGIANLVDIQPLHRRAEFLIGIPEHGNKAALAATTATLLIMDFAFNQVRLNKLTTFIYSDNSASLKNNVALGFVRESLLRDHLWHGASRQFIDLYGNSMTLADFRGNTRLARVSQRLLKRDVTAELIDAIR